MVCDISGSALHIVLSLLCGSHPAGVSNVLSSSQSNVTSSVRTPQAPLRLACLLHTSKSTDFKQDKAIFNDANGDVNTQPCCFMKPFRL